MIKSLTPCGHGHRPPSLSLPRGEFGFTDIQRERFGQAVLNRCGRIVHDLERKPRECPGKSCWVFCKISLEQSNDMGFQWI
jgi:hypothetical protein